MSNHAQAFLETWHEAIAKNDVNLLKDIVADDARLLSPAFYSPKEGQQMVLIILATVITVFEDFTYTKEWVDENELILEFTATVNDKRLKGIDRIALNDEGKLVEIEVLVRPLNSLMELAQEMGKKLGVTTRSA